MCGRTTRGEHALTIQNMQPHIFLGNLIFTCITHKAAFGKPPEVLVRGGETDTGNAPHVGVKELPGSLRLTHHIWSLIFFPLSSTVLILKSTPMREMRITHVDT